MSTIVTPASSRLAAPSDTNTLLAEMIHAPLRLGRIRILLSTLKAMTGAERAGIVIAESPETVYWSDRTEHPEPFWVDNHETHQFTGLLTWADHQPVGYVPVANVQDLPAIYGVQGVYVLRDKDDVAGVVLLTGTNVVFPATEFCETVMGLLTLVSIEQRTTNNLNKFLSEFAHDQRNSLNVVSMSADVLNEMTDLQGKSKLHLTRIFDNSLQIGNQIENALSVERYDPETDEYHMLYEPFDLVELRREVCDRYIQVAQGKKISLKQPYIRGTVMVNADRGMITRAMNNLVDNALKFTPEGGTIEVNIVRANAAKGQVQIVVKDTGPGIAPEYLERIFERKVRIRQPRLVRGLGLGLYIVRNVALMHGGKAWVESELGEGSTFYLSIPPKSPNGIK